MRFSVTERDSVFILRHQLASSSVVALRGCGHQGVKHHGFILGCEASAEAERIVEAPSKSAFVHNAFMLLHSQIEQRSTIISSLPSTKKKTRNKPKDWTDDSRVIFTRLFL